MIRIKIAEMLGKHKMTRKQLSELTGIRAGTVGLMYDETIKRLDVEWLDKLCEVFECEINDIIEYIPKDTIIERTHEQFVINLKDGSIVSPKEDHE